MHPACGIVLKMRSMGLILKFIGFFGMNKKNEISCWIPCLVLLCMSLLLSFSTLISVKNRAIWRGPGIEPTILLDKDPVDYYVFIGFLIFFSLTPWIGISMIIIQEIREKGRKAKKLQKPDRFGDLP